MKVRVVPASALTPKALEAHAYVTLQPGVRQALHLRGDYHQLWLLEALEHQEALNKTLRSQMDKARKLLR